MTLLRRISGAATEQEAHAAALAFGAFACVLSSYFLIVPLREELSIALGVNVLPKLFSASLLVTIGVAPFTATGLSRGHRGEGHHWLFLGLAGVLAAFYLAALNQRHQTISGSAVSTLQVGLYAGLYVWVGVQNLASTSSLWALCADVFSHPDAAARMFGFIGAGATFGQLVGSAASVWYVRTAGQAISGPPFELLLASCCMLLLASSLSRWLASSAACMPHFHTTAPAHGPAHQHKQPGHDPHEKQHLQHGRRRSTDGGGKPHTLHPSSSIRGRLAAGATAFALDSAKSLWLIASSPYLLTLCAFTALTYTTSALLYFERALVVSNTMHKASERASYFATINACTALLIFLMQMLATGRVITWLGVKTALSLSPAVSLAGMLLIMQQPTARRVAGVEILRKLVGYSLGKPSREVLFTVVSRQEKYRAKVLMDMVVQRLGDGVAAGVFQVLAIKPGSSTGPRLLACAGAVVCCMCLSAVQMLGTQYAVRKEKAAKHAATVACLHPL